MKFTSALLLVALLPSVVAFAPSLEVSRISCVSALFADTSTAGSSSKTAEEDGDDNALQLTPELLKITNAFASIDDDKLRYKQLLYMANQLAPMPASSQIPENKVLGCLSTVYVDGKIVKNSAGESVVEFVGDSDGLLTKGLVALLVRGLSGNTPAAIQHVDPGFIQKAGIAASLTPGRNNGFLNMLATMKKKALLLEAMAVQASSEAGHEASGNQQSSSSPKYDAIMTALEKLNPTKISLEDVSYQHAGHGDAGDESHFNLYIVADAFEGLNLVKRHKLIYMMLGEIMPQIHALQITSLTPEEAENRK